MSDDIKPEVIKKTQDTLGRYIKKPQLTEKLLKKPPFRFLHDIVTNVIKETGFLEGLFTEEELNHENIKDRDGKVAFLDKLINCVKLATGTQLTVRSTRIVAGLEPTRTNELLQAIGQAVAKKINSSQAVEEILKKSPEKAGTSEFKKKEKPSEARGAAPKQGTSRRDRKDPSITRESKAEKKDPSSTVKGPSKGQDRKSERQDAAGDAKKRSLKEKETILKSSSKPGKSTKEELVEKTRTKSSKTIKEEPENKVEEPIPNTKDKLVRSESEDDKKKSIEPETAPDEKNSAVKSDILTEKTAVIQEQHLKEGTSEVSNPVPEEVAKVTIERQRPLSALGRKRSAAVSASKQQSSEEKVEPGATTLLSSSEPEDKPTVTKPDTTATIPPTSTTSTRPPSAVPGTSRDSLDKNQLSTAAPVPLVRPRTAARQGSARPGAPRLRNRGEVALVSEEQVKPVSVNLIVEAEGAKEEEDENLVVLENTTTESAAAIIPRPDSDSARPSSGQGHLVAQILETQKELETRSKLLGIASSQAENSGHKVEIDFEAGRQRERGTALREVQRLCESIQTVTRAAHPIGKLFDSLQEDVESMQQELEHWQSMQRSLEEQLQAEEALSVQSTQPLKEHLQQLQQAVLAQQEQLRMSKANILANDQRIHKILV